MRTLLAVVAAAAIEILLLPVQAAAAAAAQPQKTSPEGGVVALPPPGQMLATLRAGHPRVMARPETWEDIRSLVAQGGLPARLYAGVKKSADEVLAAPVSNYEKPDGRRLLSVSRRVLDRVRTLALVNRVEHERRYADRAWKELEAAARFPDWNPSHFLDTAEMTHAFALGYDWLYDQWTEDQRRTLRDAIVTKGLREGLKVYDSKKGCARNENNWNQVCNGGLISGALACANMALADFDPVIPLDEVIDTAQRVASRMPRELRCTALGGLSITPTSIALQKKLADRKARTCDSRCSCG